MSLATLENPTVADKKRAEALLVRVDKLLDGVRAKEDSLQRDYVDVGLVLVEIRDSRAWMFREFHSFEAYLKNAGDKLRRGRTALYAYAAVAERLLPSVSKADLIEMGVTNASTLAQMVKITGRKPSLELIENAKLLKESDFRSAVADFSGLRTHKDTGKFFHLGEVFFEAEELEEFKRAVKAASEENELEYPVDWGKATPQVRKLILQSWYADFFATAGR